MVMCYACIAGGGREPTAMPQVGCLVLLRITKWEYLERDTVGRDKTIQKRQATSLQDD